MKRIFVVSCQDEVIFTKFVTYIKEHIPNIVTINYYKDIVYDSAKDILDSDYTLNNEDLHKKLSKIESLALKFSKYIFINKLIESITFRDTPRTVIFILCNDRIINHHIRSKFGGSAIVKTLNLNVFGANLFKEYKNNLFKSFNFVIDVSENNDILLRLLTKNFMTNIPVKWYIKNK
jgi:uncharacterized protein YbcV (DUF1398 family)